MTKLPAIGKQIHNVRWPSDVGSALAPDNVNSGLARWFESMLKMRFRYTANDRVHDRVDASKYL